MKVDDYALTPGEQAVWAARFNQTQLDVMSDLHARAAKAGNITPEQAMEMLSHATRTAIEQAHSAVVTLRRIRIGEGEAADMLAAVLGPTLAPLPAPLEGLVGPWDFLREPPPGMMFREGHPDTVVRINAEGWEHAVRLRDAWEKHWREVDPPGFKTARVDLGEYSLGTHYEVRLLCADQILKQCEAAYDPFGGDPPTPEDERKASEAARAYAWRCFQYPHHVSFWARFGDRVGARLDTVLGWSDQQLQDAWRFLQERAAWQAKEPTTPDFWPSEE